MTKWNPDICIYHGNCDDGFGAAWAIRTMWPECDFVPGFYGMDLPNVDGKNVLFVDFSAKRPVIDAIAQTAKTIVIIDHHKTAEADLAPFAVTMCGSACLNPNDIQHMFRDLAELDRPPIIAWFDTEQSGAAMAWQFAQGEHRDEGYIPLMLELIEDRDLWRFARGDTTREFSAALRTYPMDFQVWDEISENPRDLYAEGKVILRAHRANIEKLMREAYTETIGGFAVPVVNAPYHYASDTAHELLTAYPDAPFAACWFRRADGQIQWSLRSEDHRQDVSEISKGFGGGGHRNAAGFQSPAAPPHDHLEGPIVSVKTMKLSGGRADHFVSIKVGDREVHPHVFRDEFKAAYHVALYSWLLNGTDEPDLMAFNEGDWPAQKTELVGADPAKIEVLEEEIGRLEGQLEEARNVPWPEWTNKILKTVRSYSGYDGYDDAVEGIDLASEVDEALSELYSENERLRAALTTEGQP